MKKHRNRHGKYEVIKRELAKEFIQLKGYLPHPRPEGARGRRKKDDPDTGYITEGVRWIDEQLNEMGWTRQYAIGNTRFVMAQVIKETGKNAILPYTPPPSSLGRSLRLLVITSS